MNKVVEPVATATLKEDGVEIIARAFHVGTLYAPWGEMTEAARDDFRGHARRALAALRSPPEEMLKAGHDKEICHVGQNDWNGCSMGHTLAVWHAMIDAATSSSSPKGGPHD